MALFFFVLYSPGFYFCLLSFLFSPCLLTSPFSLSFVVIHFRISSFTSLTAEPHSIGFELLSKLPNQTSCPHSESLNLFLVLYPLDILIIYLHVVLMKNYVLDLRFFSSLSPHSAGPLRIVSKCFWFILPIPVAEALIVLPGFLQDRPSCSASCLFPNLQCCHLSKDPNLLCWVIESTLSVEGCCCILQGKCTPSVLARISTVLCQVPVQDPRHR